MASISDVLKAVSAYPVQNNVINAICTLRGVDSDTDANPQISSDMNFLLCRADLLVWLSNAPNVSQGGQTYSFNENERKAMRKEAEGIYNEYGEDVTGHKAQYGYKGDRL